jgi:hypothetical protein
MSNEVEFDRNIDTQSVAQPTSDIFCSTLSQIQDHVVTVSENFNQLWTSMVGNIADTARDYIPGLDLVDDLASAISSASNSDIEDGEPEEGEGPKPEVGDVVVPGRVRMETYTARPMWEQTNPLGITGDEMADFGDRQILVLNGSFGDLQGLQPRHIHIARVNGNFSLPEMVMQRYGFGEPSSINGINRYHSASLGVTLYIEPQVGLVGIDRPAATSSATFRPDEPRTGLLRWRLEF